jgi:twitching motility protein PilI
LSLLQSGEILPSARLHSVPRTAEWFMGVLNIRGSLFGAVDLGHYIGQSLSAASQTRLQSKQNVFEDDQGRFVTLNPLLDVNCALYVSELIGLRAVDSFISSLPRVLEAPAYFGPQFLDEQDTVWQELDLQILAQTPHFINISAS